MQRYFLQYHCYADDIQLNVSTKPHETEKLTVLYNGLSAIKDWMANNVLQLNADKTEVFIVASDSILVLYLIRICILINISHR